MTAFSTNTIMPSATPIFSTTVSNTLPNNLGNTLSNNLPQGLAKTAQDNHADYQDISHLNTMALQCFAKDVIYLTELSQVLPTISELQQNNIPFIILSSGSNTILPPILNASVVIPALKGIKVVSDTEETVTLQVMAGELWHSLVVDTVHQGWYGLENLALIPSWVGAAPVQNIGAYGVQIEDVIESVTALHLPTLSWQVLSRADCQFGYRDSIFKRQAGDWLITSVSFVLHKNPAVNSQYGDVSIVAKRYASQRWSQLKDSQETNEQAKQVQPIDIMHAIIDIRQSKIPDTKQLANCGSFFKNPIVPTAIADKLSKDYPKLVRFAIPTPNVFPNLTSDTFDTISQTKLAAGWLIDQAGLKGQGIAPILTHTQQALILTNHAPNFATQVDVARTMHLIQQTVEQKFGIKLQAEPVWVEVDGRVNHHP